MILPPGSVLTSAAIGFQPSKCGVIPLPIPKKNWPLSSKSATHGPNIHSTQPIYVMAVDTVGRRTSVEQNRPKAPIGMAVNTKTTSAFITCEGETPPKKKTRLNSGSEAAINRNVLANPATSLPASNEKEESREHMSIS